MAKIKRNATGNTSAGNKAEGKKNGTGKRRRTEKKPENQKGEVVVKARKRRAKKVAGKKLEKKRPISSKTTTTFRKSRSVDKKTEKAICEEMERKLKDCRVMLKCMRRHGDKLRFLQRFYEENL